MIQKLFISIVLFVTALTMPVSVYGQYGQQVLGEEAPEIVIVHKPVETGIMDNPEILGGILLVTSVVLKAISKRTKVGFSN
jgi:hypothetical protein